MRLKIDGKMHQMLSKDAIERGISPQELAYEIIENHYRWHRFAYEAGFITVRRALISKLLEEYDDVKLEKIAEYVSSKTTKSVTLFLATDYSLKSVMVVIDAWLKIVSLPHRHEVKGNHHKYLVDHDMGIKWSKYLASLMKFVGREFNIKNMVFDIREDFLLIEFDLPKSRR